MVAACGGTKVNSGSTAGGERAARTKPCGTVNIAVNPWVGYEADYAVVAYLLKNKLGCTVIDKNITEQVSWQGFESGQVDVILENWGHEDLAKTYITDKKVAVDFGSQGNKGIIGWYVPAVDEPTQYPDITDYKNLNKYAGLFKTAESGGKGQLLDGDPSYVTNDKALVKNLGLNYTVVVGGSRGDADQVAADGDRPEEAAAVLLLRAAVGAGQPQGRPGQPAAVHDRLRRRPGQGGLRLPAVRPEQDGRAKWADSGSPAVTVVKNFTWTNDDQNSVAEYIASEGMTDDAAAKKWVDANPDKVKAWLQGT